MTDCSRRRFGGLVAAGVAGVAAAGTARTAGAATPRPGLTALPPKAPVLIFGDSYVEGVGAAVKTDGWAYKVGPLLDWTVTVNGRGGSGYANPTAYNAGVYHDRLAKLPVPATPYALVVLQGSSNDEKYDSATLSAAIARTLKLARSRFVGAQLVMVGPANPYGSAGVDRVRVNNLLVQAAATHAIPYLDAIAEKWFVPGDGASFANPDNAHPNTAAHRHMRSLFVRDVQVLTG